MENLTAAARIAFRPEPSISYSPIIFSIPGRQVDLQIKVSAPATGDNLSIIIISHGHGSANFMSSMRGNAPMVDYFTTQGFVIIQPTHQDSKALNLNNAMPEDTLFWKSRAEDISYIIDNLDVIETTVPGLKGRLDKSKISTIGHSLGGHTASILAGMKAADTTSDQLHSFAETRIKAFVLIAPPGNPKDLKAPAKKIGPFLETSDFTSMTANALIINGDKDKNPNFSDRDDWRADAYYLSPSPKCLLTVFGGEHLLGGIAGYDLSDTTDESPEMAEFVLEMISAYFKGILDNDNSWEDAKKKINNNSNAKGKIDCK